MLFLPLARVETVKDVSNDSTDKRLNIKDQRLTNVGGKVDRRVLTLPDGSSAVASAASAP